MMVSVKVRERMKVRPMVLGWVARVRLMCCMAVVLLGDRWARMMVPVKVKVVALVMV